jgi:hypothetical protein
MKRALLALMLFMSVGAHAELRAVASGGSASGTASITGGTIDGAAIGNTTPSSGKFTTLSASSTVSGAGFTTYLASPPAIGGTAAAAGSFTTLSATGAVSGSGFTTYLASPPAIGGTAAAAGTFTALTGSSVTDSGLTANSFLYSGTGGLLTTTAAPTNGQLLIGSTGAAPVKATLTGTSNQISVANGAGSVTLSIPSTLAVPGTITSYNGISTASLGIPITVATLNFTAQTANVAQQTIYAVPVGQAGRYRVVFTGIVTTAASGGTPSSTMPQGTVFWTDSDSGGTPSANVGATSTGNTINTSSQGNVTVYAKAGTNIQIATTGYASAGTTAMQYAARFAVEYLGN